MTEPGVMPLGNDLNAMSPDEDQARNAKRARQSSSPGSASAATATSIPTSTLPLSTQTLSSTLQPHLLNPPPHIDPWIGDRRVCRFAV